MTVETGVSVVEGELGTGAMFALFSPANWNGDLVVYAHGYVFPNQDVQLRWLLSTDSYETGNGWWVDDITITNVEVAGDCTTQTEPPFFADGFESGDTSAWSYTHP